MKEIVDQMFLVAAKRRKERTIISRERLLAHILNRVIKDGEHTYGTVRL